MQSSLSSLKEWRKDDLGRKGVKGLLLVSHEKVPCGFGLRTGDCGGYTADGAGNRARTASWVQITRKNQQLPEPQTSIYFPEIRYPWLGKGGKERLCVFVGVLRDFGILTKILSHYSNLYNFWINSSFSPNSGIESHNFLAAGKAANQYKGTLEEECPFNILSPPEVCSVTFPLMKAKVCCKILCHVTPAAPLYHSCLPHLWLYNFLLYLI